MLVSIRRLLVFSLLGPVMGVAAAIIYDLIAGRTLEVDEGRVLAFLFSLGVATATGPVDGYLAHVLSQPLRASLSGVVGATTAAFLGYILTHQPQPLTNLAIAAAVCMGVCSLLSGPSRDILR
jgi:hypothetical protein